jgi:hypothetical protein
MKIARLRYDASDRTWSLNCADRNERWWTYDFAEPSADIDELLAAPGEDASGILRGECPVGIVLPNWVFSNPVG